MNDVLVTLGTAQIDAMFRRQDDYPVDDSEFLPLVEAALNAFEAAGVDEDVVDSVWKYAFHVYDQACKEAVPESTTADNRRLMQSYLLGKRSMRDTHAKLPSFQLSDSGACWLMAEGHATVHWHRRFDPAVLICGRRPHR